MGSYLNVNAQIIENPTSKNAAMKLSMSTIFFMDKLEIAVVKSLLI